MDNRKKNQSVDAIQIEIASDAHIRQVSKGEVTQPETINYRTLLAERHGLFCERIFGPTKSNTCACGKFKRTRTTSKEALVCDRCHVEVTDSKVRRVRMGRIELAVPYVHLWFNKTSPSVLGNLLGKTTTDLESVIYYENFIVTDPGTSRLQSRQLLTEKELREAQEEFGADSFTAKMGGEAIRELLRQVKLELPSLIAGVRKQILETRSNQTKPKLTKRLKILEAFEKSGNDPENLTMQVIPVIPPDLRPLVPLDGGRFATSDLNDLYRRVINRNNRLKKLIAVEAPEVILRNERRMLQEAVDALFDNGRHGHPVIGAGNRPLKSLAEMLKGKQGRFRQNLLGKRVDFSGRSVICVGPDLKFNQCGLPKQMALVLFEPFIIRVLKSEGLDINMRSGRKMIQQGHPLVWDALEKVIQGHPVLLNRAPTLHRLGIQAFEPVLIEGKAIRVHPLVCTAFNADFDGDQMAVHVPLSYEAQIESRHLMMGSYNIFSPASGNPITVPSQDMILGLAYLMSDPTIKVDQPKAYASTKEVLTMMAGSASYTWHDSRFKENVRHETGRGEFVHKPIYVRINGKRVLTTPGRVIFNEIVPDELGYINHELPKKKIGALISEVYRKCGLEKTIEFLDKMKELGFKQGTKAAISMAMSDIKIPEKKEEMVEVVRKEVEEYDQQYRDGTITSGEKYSQVVSAWSDLTEKMADQMLDIISHPDDQGKWNPIWIMMHSGARGSRSQIRQLGGMRGLMAKPNGEVMQRPVVENFFEGLDILSFFLSSHGARKGLADTALKTADSGYLTRRLVDVAQDVIITEHDCETVNGFEVTAIKQGPDELKSLSHRIYGRTVCQDVHAPGDTSVIIAKSGETLTREKAQEIDDAGVESVRLRSPMTCETKRGICAKCYGYNLAQGKLTGLGEAVGIVAAQSIGEPGTQLTMRTFHMGGVAGAVGGATEIVAQKDSLVVFENLRTVEVEKGKHKVINKNSKIHLVAKEDAPDATLEDVKANPEDYEAGTFTLEIGSIVHVKEGDTVKKGTVAVEWDSHFQPIPGAKSGIAVLEDVVEGVSAIRNAKSKQLEIKQFVSELHPKITIYADEEKSEPLASYFLPAGAILNVEDGAKVKAGEDLARLPRAAIKTKDITGGLPRVAELFEARKPKIAAEIAKIDGQFLRRDIQKGKLIAVIKDPETGREEEMVIPMSKLLLVMDGDYVTMGQQLTEGTVVPQEILSTCGVRELQRYLVNQVQEVYCLQGVTINDKHVEIIVRQMLQKVEILDSGDTTLIQGEVVDRKEFQKQNDEVYTANGKPALAKPVLLGITKASLGTESFISAASFQETTRVLVEAATQAKLDNLCDFKSNVIIGNKIPSGTGFSDYKRKVENEFEKEREIPDDILFSFLEPEVAGA